MKKFLTFLVIILMIALALGSCGSESSRHSSSPTKCVICGKGPATQITTTAKDYNYYCAKHYADAWQYYYGNGK